MLSFLYYQDNFSFPEEVVSLRGMSRSFSLISHGDPQGAAALNPFSPVLYMAFLFNAVAGLLYGVRHVVAKRVQPPGRDDLWAP